jgi:hypothetical protein
MAHEIERVIADVRRLIPEVEIVQMQRTHDADDDGLWWFKIPGVKEDIQIESSNYNCPFLVEHDSMKNSSAAITCRSVEETVQTIVSYLLPRREI